MEVKLDGIDASYLLWDNVWKKGAENATELNMLDVVQLSAEGAIIGWLFTSTAGTVKSKLVSNWRVEAILERCGHFRNDAIVHFYNSNTRKWHFLKHEDQIGYALQNKGATKGALVLHPILSKSTTYMEVTCSKAQTGTRIEIPTYTNSWLSNVSNKHHAATLPLEGIVSMDKEGNNLSREFVNTIVKFLESTLRIKITSIVVVVVFERLNAANVSAGTTTMSTSGGSGVLMSEARKVRLHHIRSLTYHPVINTTSPAAGAWLGSSDASEVNSSIADQSLGAGSLLPGKASRVDCCHGDFCQFVAADAGDEIAAGAGDLDDDLLFGDAGGGFSLQSEARKAINRHRPPRPGDPFQTERAGEEDGDDSAADKMDLYPGQTDHLIAAAEQRTKRNAQASQTFSSAAGSSAESLRSKHTGSVGSLQTLKSKLLAEQVKRTEKRLKVMAKSIALARQEMAEIEQRDLETLNFGTNTAGNTSPGGGKSPKSRVRKALGGPTDSGVNGGGGGGGDAHKVWPPSLTKWWLTTGRNLPKNSLSVLVPSSSAHCISQTVLSAKSPASAAPTADEAISASAKKARAAELAAAEAEEVEQANSLYFGWYYNPVRVCERCHKVYTELDRQRKLRFKHLMRKQREQADKVDDEQQRWREVEQRIFKQRQFVSRLAKMETASTAHHKAQRAQQPGGVLGSHSLAFDSVAGDADPLSGGVAFGRAFRNPVPFNGQQESNALGAVPVPSRALPPKPWGLSAEGRGDAYAQASTSILTRRILQRAPEVVHTGQFQQGNHAQGGEYSDQALEQQWQELTSQAAGLSMDPRPRYRRKVPKNSKLAKLPKNFDAERLLHPWQRQMNAMKRKLKEAEEGRGPNLIVAEEDEGLGEELQLGERVTTAQFGAADMDGTEDAGYSAEDTARQSHSADYRHMKANPGRTLPPLRNKVKSAGAPVKARTEAPPPALQGPGNRSALQQLQSIDAAWLDRDRPPTTSPTGKRSRAAGGASNTGAGTNTSTSSSATSLNSLGSPLAERAGLSGAAVDRVGNALLSGLSRTASYRSSASESIPEHSAEGEREAEEGSRAASRGEGLRPPPPHPATVGANVAQRDLDGDGEDSSEDEEIGWSPFAVR